MKRLSRNVSLLVVGSMMAAGLFLALGVATPRAEAQILSSPPRLAPYGGVLPMNTNLGGSRYTGRSGYGHGGYRHGYHRGGGLSIRGSYRSDDLSVRVGVGGHGRHHGHHGHRRHYRRVYYVYPYYRPYYYGNYYGGYYDRGYYNTTAVRNFNEQEFDVGKAKMIDHRVPIEKRVADELAKQEQEANKPAARQVSGRNKLVRTRQLLSDGWLLLTEGKSKEAADAFKQAIEAPATEEQARVGYAVAIGQLGDLSKTSFHLRQAVSRDPRVLGQVNLNPELRRQIGNLKQRFDQAVALDTKDVDSAFAVASLAYILGEVPAARGAIQTAVDADDRNKSTRQLLRLIEIRQLLANSQGDS